MNIRDYLKKNETLRAWVLEARTLKRVRTYSQQGEDLLIGHALKYLGIVKPTYMDIGANHPTLFNNTALFYKKGFRGVNIEPDPSVFAKLKRARKGDINLNIAIGEKDGEAEFYVFKGSAINTLSKEEADERVKLGLEMKKVITIPVLTVSTLVEQYCNGIFPDLLSLDAEGMDEVILHAIDFEKNYPKVICVETLIFAGAHSGEQNAAITDFLLSKGYELFAFTHANSIFCRK